MKPTVKLHATKREQTEYVTALILAAVEAENKGLKALAGLEFEKALAAQESLKLSMYSNHV